MRIASHPRLYGKYGQQSTNRDHMPDEHRLYVDQTPENALAWAREVGRATLNVVEAILANAAAEKQGVNAIFALKKVLRKHSKYELEKACQTVLDVTKGRRSPYQNCIKNQPKTSRRRTAATNRG